MTVSGAERLNLAVALDGAGWHPAAWREPAARPAELLTAGYWADLVTEAERGLLDFVTFEDALSLQSDSRHQPDARTDRVRGRLDAVLVAARVAPLTRHIGLIPTVTVTHTEPFHISTGDRHAGLGEFGTWRRAGESVRRRRRSRRTSAVATADLPDALRPSAGLFEEAADYVEVVRRLWDSWEDDAEIRDAATGRFIDRDKLHYINFAGRWFSVKGPSITPRPPQGQPVVGALAHGDLAYRLLASSADIGFVTPRDPAASVPDCGASGATWDGYVCRPARVPRRQLRCRGAAPGPARRAGRRAAPERCPHFCRNAP